jgi:hypothetical protein
MHPLGGIGGDDDDPPPLEPLPSDADECCFFRR